MYKKLVQMIIEANNRSEMNTVYGQINRAFETEKISWKDHEQLWALAEKVGQNYIL